MHDPGLEEGTDGFQLLAKQQDVVIVVDKESKPETCVKKDRDNDEKDRDSDEKDKGEDEVLDSGDGMKLQVILAHIYPV